MKLAKLTAIILILSLFVSLLAGCEEYKPPIDGEGGNGQTQQPTLDDDPTNDFTVTLRLNEQPFSPTAAIDVYWSDGFDIFVAPVDESGVARIDGLDGDYNVTLSVVPTGYAYNTNGYKATNYERNVVIDLYDLNAISGKDSSLDSTISITKTGVYSVTISEPGERVYFEYAPQKNGEYTVESWASTTEDEINPICYGYLGSSQYKYGEYLVEGLGEVGSFTRNFIHTVRIADENISISGGGSVTFTFAMTAESKSGVYPVTFTFDIKRDGGYDLGTRDKTIVPVTADMSHFDFDAFNALAGGKIVGSQTLFKDENGVEKPGAYVFDEDRYKLWEISEGGDGVYHVYDEEKYPETGGYGPILVAYIDSPTPFTDRSFTTIEYIGNNALTVNGNENYKQFIEGFAALASGDYYCVPECTCHKAQDTLKACPPGCAKCHQNCRGCPEELMYQAGYVAWCNDDGVAPVTRELKEFLQKFAVSQRYFADGEGWAEKKGIYAYEESQWLFACGYYE